MNGIKKKTFLKATGELKDELLFDMLDGINNNITKRMDGIEKRTLRYVLVVIGLIGAVAFK
jgi:hypothetical protein